MSKTFQDCIILFGGSSEERLVSVASAQNISGRIPEASLWFWKKDGSIYGVSGQALAAHTDAFTTEFSPTEGKISGSLEDALTKARGKTFIIALHGTEGEDGTLQRLLEEKQISFTGTGSVGSERAFNKVLTKRIARESGITVVDEVVIQTLDPQTKSSLEAFLTEHKKLVLKPLANGSSVGLHMVSSKDELQRALGEMNMSGYLPYVAEPFISGREITVGVRETSEHELHALPCSEVRVIQGRQFDYQGKYLGKGVEELTPAPLTEDQRKACQEVALRLHEKIGCKGYSRTDMILTEKGPVLLEINTLPGLSKASFIPQQLRAQGIELRDFFLEQINL